MKVIKQININQASIKDLDQLVTLEHECFNYDHISRRSFRNFLTKPTAQVLVARTDKKIIACAVLLFRKNSKKARLYSLVVSPLFRKQGIAEGLCLACEKIIKKQHCTHLILEVRLDNHAAISFYQKHDYVLFGKYTQFYEDNTDALRMVKTICANK